MTRRILSLISLVAIFLPVATLTGRNRAPMSIIEHIRAGGLHTIVVSDSVAALFTPLPGGTDPDSPGVLHESDQDSQPRVINGKTVGYRIQIFSDNNPRTAKNEARNKQRNVNSRFPAWRTYITFNSPYWRLKVGDFRTQGEANEAAEELRKAFPANAKEIRVVRDRINIAN